MDAQMEDAANQIAVDAARPDLPVVVWQKIMRLVASVHGPSTFAFASTSRFFYNCVFRDDIDQLNKLLDLSHLYDLVPGLRGYMLGYLTAMTLHPINNIHASIMIGTHKMWYTVDARADGARLLNAPNIRDHPQAIYNLNISKFIFGIDADIGTPPADLSCFGSGGPHKGVLQQCRTNLRKMLSLYVLHRSPRMQWICDWQDPSVEHYLAMLGDENEEVTCPLCILETETDLIRNRFQ